MFMSLVGNLGLDRSIVRFVAENISLNRLRLVKRSIRITLGLVVMGAFASSLLYLTFAAYLSSAVFRSPLLMILTVPIMLWIVAYGFLQFLAETFRGFQDIRLATLFSTVSYRLILAAGLALLWLAGETRLSVIVLLSLVSTWSSVLVAGWLLHGKVLALNRSQDEAAHASPDAQLSTTNILAISLPLLASKVAFFLLAQSGIWIVGAYLSQEDVAVFGLVMRLLSLVVMPLIMVQDIVSPMIAEMHAQGKLSTLEPILRVTSTLVGLPSILLLLGFMVFGQLFLSTVYSPFYARGALVLTILSLGQVANVLAGACGPALMMTGHQVIMMRITVVTGVGAVVLSIIAAQTFGLLGIAVAMASGMIIQNVLMVAYAKTSLGIWTHASFDIRRLKKTLRFH
jgi:O-antigen/teichoic acid export membrane protein